MNINRRRIAATGIALTTVMSMVACSNGGSGSADSDTSPSAVASASGTGRTLTIWTMNGDYTDETLAAINDEFTKETGAQVDVQTQEWSGIATKITTALSTSTPPDVIDVGNTQVASYAANGGLLDLTQYKDDLAQGQTWLDGLVDPATIDGELYAVPGLGGVRTVIYNKTMWAQAGITEAPTTYEELTADLDKVKAAHSSDSDFSAFYLPGMYWYAGLQFVWDAGGEIATQDGDKWTSGFSSAQAQQGLQDFADFQNSYSTAGSDSVDTNDPDQSQLFADGKTSAILYTTYKKILANSTTLTQDDLGTFPFPGKSGQNQPVMLGGSDWAIPAKSQNTDLALVWAKIAASPDIQNTWVFGKDRWIPNSKEGIEAAQPTLPDIDKSFFTAALNSKATPANANWTTLESNKDINNLFSSIASGSKSVKDAASDFDATANKALNADN